MDLVKILLAALSMVAIGGVAIAAMEAGILSEASVITTIVTLAGLGGYSASKVKSG